MNSQESDGFSSEEGKRKRDEEGNDPTKRSKKTLRTPPKKNEDKLDNLTVMLERIILEIQEIKKNQEEYQVEIAGMKQENIDLKKENQKLKQEVGHLKHTVEQIDKENRRNNIIVHGMEIKDDMEKNINELIASQLQVEATTKEIYKLGPTVYKVKLNNWKDKEHIMKNKNKLKNFGNGKIYISHDLTKTELETQRKLRNVAAEERSKGREVKMGYQKITMDGKMWTWDCEEEQIKEYNDRNRNTKTKN